MLFNIQQLCFFLWRHFGAKYKTCDTDYTDKGIDQIASVIREPGGLAAPNGPGGEHCCGRPGRAMKCSK